MVTPEEVKTAVSRLLKVAGVVTFLIPGTTDDKVVALLGEIAQTEAAAQIIAMLLNLSLPERQAIVSKMLVKAQQPE